MDDLDALLVPRGLELTPGETSEIRSDGVQHRVAIVPDDQFRVASVVADDGTGWIPLVELVWAGQIGLGIRESRTESFFTALQEREEVVRGSEAEPLFKRVL